MNSESQPRRGAAAAACALLLLIAGCSSSRPASPSSAQLQVAAAPSAATLPNPEFQSAFAQWNYYRQSAGLFPVEYDAQLGKAAAAHSRYLAENHVLGADAFVYDGQIRSAMVSTGIRGESVGNQWYTEAGSTAASDSYVVRSDKLPSDGGELVDALMSQGVNGLRILDPQLALVGEGAFCKGNDCVITVCYKEGLTREQFLSMYDVSTFGFNPLLGRVPFTRARLRKAVYFPAAGMQARRTTLGGTTEPNPLTSCPGYTMPVGAPIWLELGASVTGAADVTSNSHSLEDNGIPVESCEIDATNYSNPDGYFQPTFREVLNATGAIMLVPREPLKAGHTYTVEISADSQHYKWSFSVAPGGN